MRSLATDTLGEQLQMNLIDSVTKRETANHGPKDRFVEYYSMRCFITTVFFITEKHSEEIAL